MLNKMETRVRSALLLVGRFDKADQNSERALVSISLNIMQTRTKGSSS